MNAVQAETFMTWLLSKLKRFLWFVLTLFYMRGIYFGTWNDKILEITFR